MKDTYYFSHDYNPTSDPKIQALIGEHGAVGYGLYWRIVEMLHEEETHKLPCKKYIYLALAKQMSTSVEQVEIIVKCCIELCELFVSDNELFWSERVLRNIEKRTEISNKRSEAGKKSAELRKMSTSVEQVSTSVQQNPTKESKGKKRKEKEDKDNKEDLPTNLFCDDNLDSGKDEELKAEFDKFRKKYPGNGKNGVDTEWDYFKKKHKDYKKIVPILNDSLDVIKIRRESRKKLKLFVPEWKYFRTWINGRCWEEALETSESDIQAEKIIDVKLGSSERIDNGRRTYGSGRVTVPMDAKPRPSDNYQWSIPNNDWVYSI